MISNSSQYVFLASHISIELWVHHLRKQNVELIIEFQLLKMSPSSMPSCSSVLRVEPIPEPTRISSFKFWELTGGATHGSTLDALCPSHSCLALFRMECNPPWKPGMNFLVESRLSKLRCTESMLLAR
jgi:hypothetical protein